MRVDVLCGLGLWRAVKRAVAVDGDAVQNPMGIAVIKQRFVSVSYTPLRLPTIRLV